MMDLQNTNFIDLIQTATWVNENDSINDVIINDSKRKNIKIRSNMNRWGRLEIYFDKVWYSINSWCIDDKVFYMPEFN